VLKKARVRQPLDCPICCHGRCLLDPHDFRSSTCLRLVTPWRPGLKVRNRPFGILRAEALKTLDVEKRLAMKSKTLRFGKGFRVAISNRRTQAAEMVIEPGDSEGGPTNRHRGADQWLFVISGFGVARINGRRQRLKAGALLLIEHGERHEIENTGRDPLKTLNFYSPPAYTRSGDELPRGRS
jgi:mannose-6-phosphate isomerase-like protein (cupin superfamily)